MIEASTVQAEWGTVDGKRILKGVHTIKDGEELFVYSDEWKQAVRLHRIKVSLTGRGIDPSIFDRTLNDYRGEDSNGNIPLLKRYVAEFDTRFKSAHLYIWSKCNGTQKSTTAKVIAKDLALAGKSVWFITMGDLSARLKNQDWNEDDASLVESLLGVDFLVVDDAFDPRKVTLYKSKFQLSFLDTFFRERLEVVKKATAFTSNFCIEDLTETFGVSLKSLIQRSTRQFEFNDPIEGKLNIEELWN